MRVKWRWTPRVLSLPFAAETFDPKKFFELVGMRAMSAEEVKQVFRVLDVDGSGFIEEDELKWDIHIHQEEAESEWYTAYTVHCHVF